MERKHYFTRQAKAYAAFRPDYPGELYDFIFSHLRGRSCAWDCATGNGQVAKCLAMHVDKVLATDISQEQLDNAVLAPNITYSLSRAEKTQFQDHQFDLITVGQALHWFEAADFYAEVRRTGRPDGLLAVWGYAQLTVEPEIDNLFLDFYHNVVGPYWDDRRKLVENHYRDIPFPFKQLACPEFFIKVNWTIEQFTGYLSSWSATQKYILSLGNDPVQGFYEDLRSVWRPGEAKLVKFPVFMKAGRIGS